MTKGKTRNLEVRGIVTDGPFIIPAPPGKVVLLLGHNGAGKSRALESVRALTSGRGDVTAFDGVARGEISGFDTVLRVGRRTNRVGKPLDELEIRSIEGRFDVSVLVNPGFKEPDAANRERIKALVQLAGASADAALFYNIVGGGQEQFTHYVSPAALETDDLVTMAARIKRDFEKHARLAHDEAEREVAAAEATRKLTEGIDMTAPADAEALQADLELAIIEHQRVQAEAKNNEKVLAAAAVARTQLELAQAKQGGPTLEQAMAADAETLEQLKAADAEVLRCEQLLRDARAAAERAKLQHDNAALTLQQVTSHAETLAQWRAAIETAAAVTPVESELLEALAADVTAARLAVEQGAIVRQALQRNSDAEAHVSKAAEWRSVSDALREAGRATDDVLSDVVQQLGCPLRVSAGVLVTDTHRGETPFAELSDGERWKIALDIAIDAVGPNGVLTIEQHAWQDLDPDNRQMIKDRVAMTDCTLFTAQCDEGELRAEVLE